jgi:hypothetical protein
MSRGTPENAYELSNAGQRTATDAYSSTDSEQGHTMETGGNTAVDRLPRKANW